MDADFRNTLWHFKHPLPTLKRLLDTCGSIINEIEHLLKHSFVKSEVNEDSLEIRAHRFAWVQKRREVKQFQQRLRDTKALLAFQLVGINTYVTYFRSCFFCDCRLRCLLYVKYHIKKVVSYFALYKILHSLSWKWREAYIGALLISNISRAPWY